MTATRKTAADRITHEQWARYLELVGEHGTKRLCALRVGLWWPAVCERMEHSPQARREVDDAMELCADRLEEMLSSPDMAKSQVVGLIVRLKAVRPNQYIERAVSMNVSLTAQTQVSPEEARALLASLVKDAQPHTVRALMEAGRG